MRYAIDTRKISKERASSEQIKLNRWKTGEAVKMGLMAPYDSYDNNTVIQEIKLTQFKTRKEYDAAIDKAMELLDNFQQVPEPMRTKLILEAENLRKHGKNSVWE